MSANHNGNKIHQNATDNTGQSYIAADTTKLVQITSHLPNRSLHIQLQTHPWLLELQLLILLFQLLCPSRKKITSQTQHFVTNYYSNVYRNKQLKHQHPDLDHLRSMDTPSGLTYLCRARTRREHSQHDVKHT